MTFLTTPCARLSWRQESIWKRLCIPSSHQTQIRTTGRGLGLDTKESICKMLFALDLTREKAWDMSWESSKWFNHQPGNKREMKTFSERNTEFLQFTGFISANSLLRDKSEFFCLLVHSMQILEICCHGHVSCLEAFFKCALGFSYNMSI